MKMRAMIVPAILIALGFFLPTRLIASQGPIPSTIDFNRDIRPILSENCYFCHGPDKNKRKADLRLDEHDGLFSVIKDHSTVVPGKPDESELFKRVTASDPAERMPDPKSNKRLSDRQIAVLRKWIEQGAPWKGHWAYIPPVRPAMPEVADDAFVTNPIDRFVLARLKEAGLQHAPQADRVTLIRRLSFDLIGLPPTQAQVREFVDDKSPNAYEKLVDRLLASPQFGERMAINWLDQVRYADSIGYHSDNPMNVWPYRDYVIRAFNENKPFDQFTREQLAGDLAPNATLETKVASAYNRLIETTEEGGAQAKEYAVKYECDRVRNISTVWMAATMGCCQCHDHKFDPYSQKDFYSMAAFFADIQEAPIGRREPGMLVLDDQQVAHGKKLDDQIAELKKQLDVETPELSAAQDEWEKRQQDDPKIEWTTLTPQSLQAKSGTVLKVQPDGSILGSKFAPKDTFVVKATTDQKRITGIRLEALPDPTLPQQGPGASDNGNFVLTGFKVAAKGDGALKLARATADHSQDTFPIESAIAGKKQAGWAILPQVGQGHVAVFEPASRLGEAESTAFTFTLEFQSAFPQHEIGHFRLSITTNPTPAGRNAIPEKVKPILAIAPENRTAPQKKEVAAYYRTIAPLLQPLRDEKDKAQKEKDKFTEEAAKCLVSTSGTPRVTRLLHRGNWQDDTGDVESPDVPHFLPQPAGKKDRLTRLDLADWLVSRDNPLTARVYVNRLWKMFLGTGISKSLDDLGSQGESPTNPELLDWLAVEFKEPAPDSGNPAHAWDVKRMIRLIVTSGTYRQSSLATAQDQQVDPFNRLYSHQSRFRLDAEVVRDNALDISGLLSLKMGGPSAKPYQPGGYWDALNFPARTYEADKGENQYRRGVYTWWQRTFVHPSLLAFDAATHEESTCERTQSNIPQQALVLLNDPTYVEAARVFAVRVMHEGGSNTADRLHWAFETALNREPRAQELEVLSNLYAKHLEEYSQDKTAADKLLGAGDAPAPKDLDVSELAAWTSVSRVILNLSETITRS
jgi:hypothetical protein